MTELKVPEWKLCEPDVRIYRLLFAMLNVSILIHMARIASTIKILFQIY